MVKNIAFRINTSYNNHFRANCQTILIIYFHNTVYVHVFGCIYNNRNKNIFNPFVTQTRFKFFGLEPNLINIWVTLD